MTSKPKVILRARRTAKGRVTGWTVWVMYPEFDRIIYHTFPTWLEAMNEVDIIHWLYQRRLAPLWAMKVIFR